MPTVIVRWAITKDRKNHDQDYASLQSMHFTKSSLWRRSPLSIISVNKRFLLDIKYWFLYNFSIGKKFLSIIFYPGI
jgi:hypothetical protein